MGRFCHRFRRVRHYVKGPIVNGKKTRGFYVYDTRNAEDEEVALKPVPRVVTKDNALTIGRTYLVDSTYTMRMGEDTTTAFTRDLTASLAHKPLTAYLCSHCHGVLRLCKMPNSEGYDEPFSYMRHVASKVWVIGGQTFPSIKSILDTVQTCRLDHAIELLKLVAGDASYVMIPHTVYQKKKKKLTGVVLHRRTFMRNHNPFCLAKVLKAKREEFVRDAPTCEEELCVDESEDEDD
jgi:hypothetical protein